MAIRFRSSPEGAPSTLSRAMPGMGSSSKMSRRPPPGASSDRTRTSRKRPSANTCFTDCRTTSGRKRVPGRTEISRETSSGTGSVLPSAHRTTTESTRRDSGSSGLAGNVLPAGRRPRGHRRQDARQGRSPARRTPSEPSAQELRAGRFRHGQPLGVPVATTSRNPHSRRAAPRGWGAGEGFPLPAEKGRSQSRSDWLRQPVEQAPRTPTNQSIPGGRAIPRAHAGRLLHGLTKNSGGSGRPPPASHPDPGRRSRRRGRSGCTRPR